MSDANQPDLTILTVQLLSAYVANNSVANEDLATLILSTRKALEGEPAPAEPETPEFVPAVSVRKSLASREALLSLIDGKPYKTLKRHLATHGLTPGEYRERYKLPSDYPMVAPAFAEQRRAIATRIGLGRKPDAAPGVDTDTPPSAVPSNGETSKAAPTKTRAAKAKEAKPAASESAPVVEAAQPIAQMPATRGRKPKGAIGTSAKAKAPTPGRSAKAKPESGAVESPSVSENSDGAVTTASRARSKPASRAKLKIAAPKDATPKQKPVARSRKARAETEA